MCRITNVVINYAGALSRRLSRLALPRKVAEGHRSGAILCLLMLCSPALADPAPASIYAALQVQRNTCQDQAALATAGSTEQVAKLQAELAALKKDFGVE